MNDNAIHGLLFSEGGVEQSLLDSGRFSASWLTSFQSAIEALSSSCLRSQSWPKKVFQSLHYASTHLPLRYRVWATSSHTRNIHTEYELSELRFSAESYLWSSLFGLPRWSDSPSAEDPAFLSEHDARLIDLCFGLASPVCAAEKATSFQSWAEEYDACLRFSSQRWTKKSHWPKWLCMAVHYASFYIDLFQMRDFELTAVFEEDEIRACKIREILDGLKTHISNDSILSIIRIWLETCSANRDSSGLPLIGTLRPRTGQFRSVRTTSEVFLLDDLYATDHPN